MWAFMVLAILAGMLMPFQGLINAELAQKLSHPLQASLISFLLGSLSLAVIILCLRLPILSWSTKTHFPPYLFIGGLMGAFFVTAALLLINKLGALTMTALFIVGQFSAGIMIDHFGWLSVPQTPLTWKRALGVLLLLIGTSLIRTRI